MNPIQRLAELLARPTTAALAEAAARPRVAAAQEAVGPDPDEELYRALGTGLRDLSGLVLRRGQDISVSMYRKNPLANRIIKIYTTYMAGTGFTISADNPEVQAICTEFWDAERNQMPTNHRNFARDFLLFGEAPHPVSADETGNTTVGYLDPRRIARVDTNPNNNLIIEALHLTNEFTGEAPPLQVVRRQTDPTEPDAGLYTGDTFYWLYDRIGASVRGTPFLLPALDWLDAYDQTLWELLERVKAVRAFFWDVEVEGGAEEIKDAKKEWGTTAPRSGSVRFRSPGIKVDATQPQIGAYEDVAAARYLLRHIATAAGVAPHWLGDPEDANRSTAQEMDKPVLRALEDVQAQWKTNMETLLKYAVDRKVAAGMIAAVVEVHDEQGRPTGDLAPAASLVEVNAPALTDDEMEAAAASLTQVAGAFVQLDMIEAIDRETIRKVVRHILPALGIPADELPDPEEANEEKILAALEAIQARAQRSGALEHLEEELARTA